MLILIIIFTILNIVDIIQTKDILFYNVEANPIVRKIGFKWFIVYKTILIALIYGVFHNYTFSGITILGFLIMFYTYVVFNNYHVIKWCESE